MDRVIHTVVQGDTLWDLVQEYGVVNDGESTMDAVKRIAELNGIPNPDVIGIGQKIVMEGTPPAADSNKTYIAKVQGPYIQSNQTNVLFVTWVWDKSYTEKYAYEWVYYIDGKKFYGSTGSITVDEYSPNASKFSSYTIPDGDVDRVEFRVKPISKTRKVGNSDKETAYWTATWSTTARFDTEKSLPPAPPSSAPTVTVEKLQLTASYANLDVTALLNPTHMVFYIYEDRTTMLARLESRIVNGYASCTCQVKPGHIYTVRCKSIRRTQVASGFSGGDDYFTDFSNEVATIPPTPVGFTDCKANRDTTTGNLSVFLKWDAVETADTYDIQYATNVSHFEGSDQPQSITGVEETQREIFSLTPGAEYFFRLRAVNESGESEWSEITSVVLGKKPAAPTTWSSTNTAIVDEDLNLYWVHNSEDGSNQTFYNIQIFKDGAEVVNDDVETIFNVDDDNTAHVYTINTTSSEWSEGAVLEWRVRTAGVTKEYGEWSVLRRVDIYARPTLELSITTSSGMSYADGTSATITSFPFYLTATASPTTQTPLGYSFSIISKEFYETVDAVGNNKYVNAGDAIFSTYLDEPTLSKFKFSAGNLDLENNASYTITCTVTMNSGLTAEKTFDFTVAWADEQYSPNAEISIDESNYSANIRPHCEDNNGRVIDGVLLSVYRREFDGSFTEIASNLANSASTFVVDPHPALDYARYRIVATTENTGTVGYYDVPPYPVGGKTVIIQWDEAWSEFDGLTDDPSTQPSWSGSLLKLPYNIDVSDKHSNDVSLIEYIGRKHPVSYYGTQLGEASTWNVVIDKKDVDTLYALRRLAVWMGNVYVREPSGTGYWANINVSFSQKHRDVTIPVTLDITRVEGGM